MSGGTATCDSTAYASLDVPVAALTGNATALTTSLATHSPGGMTPTGPALQGTLESATAWGGAHPDHIVAVVLATDGVPTECSPTDASQIGDIAAAAASSATPILTYVVGIGDLPELDPIAAAGETHQAILVTADATAGQQLTDALATIHAELQPCAFEIPPPTQGQIDTSLINVRVTRVGQSPEIVSPVAGAQDCDPTSGGWYYDTSANPTLIVTCRATCDLFVSPDDALLEVVHGCETVTP